MKVYGDVRSGNCYKVKLLLTLLNIEHQWVEVDIMAKEQHSAEFKAINPNGKIPAVVLEDGRALSESNAILGYFADHTQYLPTDSYGKAQVYQWMFFEQYSHEPYIAVARFIKLYLGLPDNQQARYQALMEPGNKALAMLDQQLSQTLFLVGDSLTIADIALYAYTHVAAEGGFDLHLYPHISAWCKRIAALPNYVALG
ncbi:glutathione S-transferase family protein [Shewanella waksmanii]|uniref:glutathione S-transferase family protein n=1 Tax=Shewanella waksmanii TaxID=213783 RepID=UPI003735556E